MKIGVLSDTHGNLGLMTRAAQLLRSRFGVDRLIHLGDNWEDQEFLIGFGALVSGVPGLWCDAYQNPRVPRVRADTFGGARVAYAHCENDVHPLASDVALVLTGHTHRAMITLLDGIPWLNPGHLTGTFYRNQAPSFGLAAIGDEEISLAILELNGDVRDSRRFQRRDTAPGPR